MDELGVPQYGERDRETVLAAFAPAFEIDTTGDYDKFGPLRWTSGVTPEPDTSRPTVYNRIASPPLHSREKLLLLADTVEKPLESCRKH